MKYVKDLQSTLHKEFTGTSTICVGYYEDEFAEGSACNFMSVPAFKGSSTDVYLCKELLPILKEVAICDTVEHTSIKRI